MKNKSCVFYADHTIVSASNFEKQKACVLLLDFKICLLEFGFTFCDRKQCLILSYFPWIDSSDQGRKNTGKFHNCDSKIAPTFERSRKINDKQHSMQCDEYWLEKLVHRMRVTFLVLIKLWWFILFRVCYNSILKNNNILSLLLIHNQCM